LILAVCAFAHIDARLLLLREPFSEEISAAGDLQRVIGFYGEEFSNTLSDAITARNIVKIPAGIARLFFDPGTRARGILIFEPAVRVRDGNTVKNINHGFNG